MQNLSKNIKQLRINNSMSQKELSELLQVSQTTIAHYEAGTRQPNIETLINISSIFNESIDRLVGNTLKNTNNLFGIRDEDLIDTLVNTLISKKENEFIEIFEKSILPKYLTTDIFEKVFKQVLYKIGTMWERGLVTEADEHYATNVIRKVNNIISYSSKDVIKRKRAITLTVNSELHTVGIEMVNIYLESLGVDSLYLGNNVPHNSLVRLIEEYKPNYIFISITMNDHINTLNLLINDLINRFGDQIQIGIGGQGVSSRDYYDKFNNVHIFNTLSELSNLNI
jgi:methanogenic corrinoid protein MtbC1